MVDTWYHVVVLMLMVLLHVVLLIHEHTEWHEGG
jgi:hypothetical protein